MFAHLTPSAVAWWRVALAASVFLMWRRPWRDGLTRTDLWQSAIFGVAMTPMFMWSVPVVLVDVWMLAALAGVALLSTVVPYSLEALAMSRLSAATFALLASLLPATSSIVGALLLRQLPSFGEVCGLALISLAIALTSRRDPA